MAVSPMDSADHVMDSAEDSPISIQQWRTSMFRPLVPRLQCFLQYIYQLLGGL